MENKTNCDVRRSVFTDVHQDVVQSIGIGVTHKIHPVGFMSSPITCVAPLIDARLTLT